MFLILGPALNLVAGFFWHDGSQGVTGGTLTALSTGCWLLGLIGVYGRLRPRSPRYVAAALGVAVFGAVGGVAFAVQAIYEQVLGVSHAEAIDRLNQYPLAATALFWICGPLFPTALAAFGVLLFRLRAAPLMASVLIVAGSVAFPASRVTRQASIAHLADLLLLLPFLYLGVRQLRTAGAAAPQAVSPQPSAR